MVQRAVRQEVSKLSPVSPSAKSTPPPRKNSKSRGKDRSSSKNRKQQRRRDSSQDARNQRSSSPAAKNAQGRRNQSRTPGLGLDQPDDPDFNPKLYVKTGWNPPREDPDLEENLYKIRQELLENFNQTPPRWTNNLTSDERRGLRELKENPTVRVLATDKNLEPALVATD
ncbi:hypothetical protein ACROYT_G023153 [Oculina patagonica]